MAHGYHALSQWNQWLTQHFLGANVLATEQTFLTRLLKRHFGKHALLIGVPHQYELLKSTLIPCHTLISPLVQHGYHVSHVESDFHDLPLLTGSIDLVMLPHTLEFVENPRQLLAEACRIIKPEGLIVICGFNPYSLWGLKKWLTKSKKAPWRGSYIPLVQIKRWLQLADYDLENEQRMFFRPPLEKQFLYQKLSFIEQIGQACFPVFGSIYILVARAKVIPLTPIKLKWKQRLDNIRISTSISGHIAR